MGIEHIKSKIIEYYKGWAIYLVNDYTYKYEGIQHTIKVMAYNPKTEKRSSYAFANTNLDSIPRKIILSGCLEKAHRYVDNQKINPTERSVKRLLKLEKGKLKKVKTKLELHKKTIKKLEVELHKLKCQDKI